MQRSTELTFTVSTHYLSALINSDYSGLETHEMGIVEDFYNDIHSQAPEGFEWGHLSVSNDYPELDTCEICDLLADCVTVTAIYWNKQA